MSDNKYNNVMHLGNPTNTIAVLNRYGFDFKKKFGQNFLIDENVVEKIVREAGVTKDDFVVEVGPGIGTMPEKLLPLRLIRSLSLFLQKILFLIMTM